MDADALYRATADNRRQMRRHPTYVDNESGATVRAPALGQLDRLLAVSCRCSAVQRVEDKSFSCVEGRSQLKCPPLKPA